MKRNLKGFTLIELLAALVVTAILIGVGFSSYRGLVDKAKQTRCAGNLRTIIGGTLLWIADNDGKLWSGEQAGNSVYRMIDDPLGIPYLLREYVPRKAWLCPAGRSTLTRFGNNYVWTSANFNDGYILSREKPRNVILFWDAYDYSLPSMYDVAEPVGNGRYPQNLKSQRTHYRPHKNRTVNNWAAADGHVFSGATAAQN